MILDDDINYPFIFFIKFLIIFFSTSHHHLLTLVIIIWICASPSFILFVLEGVHLLMVLCFKVGRLQFLGYCFFWC
jgi:hypothetical protein